jgi:hypothetical protein
MAAVCRVGARSSRRAGFHRTHHVVDGAEDLLDLAHLRLVLQEDGRVEVGDLEQARGSARSAPAMARGPSAAASPPGRGRGGAGRRASRQCGCGAPAGGCAGGQRRAEKGAAADLLIGELQHGLALAGVREGAGLHDGVGGALIVAAPAAEPATAAPAEPPSAAAPKASPAPPERRPHPVLLRVSTATATRGARSCGCPAPRGPAVMGSAAQGGLVASVACSGSLSSLGNAPLVSFVPPPGVAVPAFRRSEARERSRA